MEENEKSFLGTGWGFPPTFTKEGKGVVMISDEEDINSSLAILLSTRVKERVMRPTYGCDLSDLLFEPMNLTMLTYMKGLVNDAIIEFEPRIKLLDLGLEAEQMEGRVTISVEYEIRGTNSRFNFVYPFYIQEGSNIEK